MKVELINENFKDNYLFNLLNARGVENINAYLNPKDYLLNDFKLLKNIDEGIELLDEILNKDNSKIFLVIDADVDGFTSSAIFYNYIKKYKPDQYIDYALHEHKEHGLQDHIDNIINNDILYDLICLPDSSSNDYEFHEKLKEIGSKCLILDHHEIDKDQLISDNAIIINNQLSPYYPNKDLTGAGVTWQFCRAHGIKHGNNYWEELIDLAALGICGDMGSILDLENRYIMIKGFNSIKNYFFKCAIDKQSYSMGGEVNPISVAFYIVPMMNALIRVGTMSEKERLFIGLTDGTRLIPCNKRGAAGTEEEAAIESLRECTNAKAKQTRITDQMAEAIEQKIYKNDLLSNKILFIRLDDEDNYPPEITGLCAMRTSAKFKHPTLIGRLNSEGINKGSIRNVPDCELTDLKLFLNESGFFNFVQGHPNSAGFSIDNNKLSSFHEYANEVLKDIDFNEGIYKVNFIRNGYDNDIIKLIFDICKYPSVWGQNCSEPLIYIDNLYITKEDIQIIGQNKDTIKIEKNGVCYIKFKANDMITELKNYKDIKLSFVGKANINKYRGEETPQIFIDNYEIEDSLFSF